MNERHDDLQEIIDKALEEMAAEAGEGFDPQTCNLAEFRRRTGLTRSKARTIKTRPSNPCRHSWQRLPLRPNSRTRERLPRLQTCSSTIIYNYRI